MSTVLIGVFLLLCSNYLDSVSVVFQGYVVRISGGNDKQGFPMKQGILTTGRVRLLLSAGHSCYRPRRDGERRRKSVRGCIVDANLSVLNLVIVKKGVPSMYVNKYVNCCYRNKTTERLMCISVPTEQISKSLSQDCRYWFEEKLGFRCAEMSRRAICKILLLVADECHMSLLALINVPTTRPLCQPCQHIVSKPSWVYHSVQGNWSGRGWQQDADPQEFLRSSDWRSSRKFATLMDTDPPLKSTILDRS